MNEKPCGIIVLSPFCHPHIKNIIKVSRIVIYPEFQGFGIAGKCLDFISKYFYNLKKRVRITTTHPSIIGSLKKNKNWILSTLKRQINNSKTGNGVGGTSANRYSSTWEYKPKGV